MESKSPLSLEAWQLNLKKTQEKMELSLISQIVHHHKKQEWLTPDPAIVAEWAKVSVVIQVEWHRSFVLIYVGR